MSDPQDTPTPPEPTTWRPRTPEEEQEWCDEKRAEYEADRICGHHWSNF